MQTARPHHLAFLLLLLAPSCSDSPASGPGQQLDTASNSLSSKNYEQAAQEFERVLEQVEPTSDEYAGARIGQLQALAHADPERMLSELAEIPAESRVRARDYRLILDELVGIASEQHRAGDAEAGSATMEHAYALLEAGKQTYPEYDKWDELVALAGDQAMSMGNASSDLLRGLGYTGGDEPVKQRVEHDSAPD